MRAGSSQFVTQVVYTHACQTIASSNAACNAPPTVRLLTRKCDSWVTAKT